MHVRIPVVSQLHFHNTTIPVVVSVALNHHILNMHSLFIAGYNLTFTICILCV